MKTWSSHRSVRVPVWDSSSSPDSRRNGEEDKLPPGAAAAQSGPLQLGKQNRTEEEVEASVSVLDQQQPRLDPKLTQSEPHWPKRSLRWFEPSGPQEPAMVT